jgi:UDP-2,3-diacylglucosamine hydrolase
MWVKEYFTEELGIQIFRRQQAFIINGKRCLVGHGDGLGPKEYGYKLIKRLFAFRPHVRLYGMLHPYFAFKLAYFLSRKSRAMSPDTEQQYMGDNKETLTQYVLALSQQENIDCFIYGHRHLPILKELQNGAIYYNTGDWIVHNSFLRMDKESMKLYKKTTI